MVDTVANEIVAGAAGADLPDELSDPHGYICDVNDHLRRLLELVEQIPTTKAWDVVTPEHFRKRTSSLTSPAKIGAFWLDQTNQAIIFGALAAWKSRSIAQSLVRAVNGRELIAPALLSRALLELATATLLHVRDAIGVFIEVARSDKPVIGDDVQMKRLEETLEKAIWGTRIGTSKRADKTLLWERHPYPDGSVEATNIQTAFQKVAGDRDDAATTAFKVYEWLCDIVHPATQGLRVFWESCSEIAPGHRRIIVRSSGANDAGTIDALVLWAAGYSAVMLYNTLTELGVAVSGVQGRLATTYGLRGAGRGN